MKYGIINPFVLFNVPDGKVRISFHMSYTPDLIFTNNNSIHSLLVYYFFDFFFIGTIKLILEYVTYSLKNAHHVYFGYHLEEFLTGLSHLAVKDENKDLVRVHCCKHF